YAYQHQGRLRVLDMSWTNPSRAYAAGEIISTTRDLDRFANALLGGDLLPADLLAELRAAVPSQGGDSYGLGLEVVPTSEECGGVYEGHSGGIHGYNSFLLRSTNGARRLVVSVTLGAVDLTDQEAAIRYVYALQDLMATALCGAEEPTAPFATAVTPHL
ncbi:serine hydrolase, partial [Actinophytocola xanthii]